MAGECVFAFRAEITVILNFAAVRIHLYERPAYTCKHDVAAHRAVRHSLEDAITKAERQLSVLTQMRARELIADEEFVANLTASRDILHQSLRLPPRPPMISPPQRQRKRLGSSPANIMETLSAPHPAC